MTTSIADGTAGFSEYLSAITSVAFGLPMLINGLGTMAKMLKLNVIWEKLLAGIKKVSDAAEDKYLATEATCTAAATYYKSCECGAYTKAETFVYGEKNPENHTGTEVEDAPAITATCKTEGFTASTKWSCCDAPIKAAESLGYDENNHEGEIVPSADNKPATATEPGLEGKTVYSICGHVVNEGTAIPALGHTVKFFDKNGTQVYTAQIQDGETAAAAAEEALKVIGTVVGYTFKGWDNDVNASVNGEASFTATYERDIETKYQTSINGEPVQEVAFDTKITVKAGKKSLWKINGEKYHIGETVVAYSFGAMAITAEELPADVDENKAFVSLLEVKKTSGELVAFVHVYAGAGEVAEYGANFWNVSTGKDKNIVVTAGADAMITLYGVKAGAQRGVKAYAKVNGDAIYSEKTAEYTF